MGNTPKWFDEALEEYHRCYNVLGISEPKNGDRAHDLGWQGQYGDISVHTDEEFNKLVKEYNIDEERSAGKIAEIIINTLKDSNLEVFVAAVMGSLNHDEAPSFSKDFVKEKGFSADKYRDTAESTLLETKEPDIKEAYRLYTKYLMKYSPWEASATAKLIYNNMEAPGSKYFGMDVIAAVNVITINIIHHSIQINEF